MTDCTKFRQKIARTSWKNLMKNFRFLKTISRKSQFDVTRISKFLITKVDRAKQPQVLPFNSCMAEIDTRFLPLNIFEAKQFLSNRTCSNLYIDI